jgi:hypothetical protein
MVRIANTTMDVNGGPPFGLGAILALGRSRLPDFSLRFFCRAKGGWHGRFQRPFWAYRLEPINKRRAGERSSVKRNSACSAVFDSSHSSPMVRGACARTKAAAVRYVGC